MSVLDNYLMEKQAISWGGVGQGLKNAFKPGSVARDVAAHAAIATTITAVPVAATKIYNAITKQHSFNQMMEQNPDLHDIRAMEPKRFNNFYSSLHNMNPQHAQDPIVAGSYMRKMLAEPSNAGFAVSEGMRSTTEPRESFQEALHRGGDRGAMGASSAYNERLKEQTRQAWQSRPEGKPAKPVFGKPPPVQLEMESVNSYPQQKLF